MIDPPKNRKEAAKMTYGHPAALPYSPERCAYSVWERSRATINYQCLRKPGYGPDGLFCKQHDPAAAKAREDASAARYRAEMNRMLAPERNRALYRAALKRIAKKACTSCDCATIAENALAKGGSV